MAQSAAFETQLLSLIAEGVFQKFPGLKVVLIEFGLHLAAGLLWRTNKTWRGVRAEVPWIDRPPAEIVRDHVRFTLQPFDAPPDDPEVLARTLEQIGSDELLLFSTDYPHWQFDGDDVLPDGLAEDTIDKMLVDNALETYPRLREAAARRDPGAETRRRCHERAGPRAAGSGASGSRSSTATSTRYAHARRAASRSCRSAGASTGRRSARIFRHGADRASCPIPRMMAGGMRVDSFPENGGRPAPTST